MSDELHRAPGDDVVISLRVRRSAFGALRGERGLDVCGRMGLVEGGDGVYALVVWTMRVPDWPDPVPGNEESAHDLARRRG